VIRKVSLRDKEKYIAMSREFYHSDAVMRPIPDGNLYGTFDAVVSGSPYMDAYICEYDGKTAGYALLAITYSNEAGGLVLWLEELYILPQYRGRGLGKAVIEFVEEQYRTKVARFRLEVEGTNEKAISLYRKMKYARLEYQQMYKDV
jgi:ribosomal protein S18 acetylase RimI-like enzyme